MTERADRPPSGRPTSASPDGRARLVVVVRGVVQGVGFRWFVERTATGLGLGGWVANRSDGAVELVAEGPRDRLEQLVAAVREGPPGAAVHEVVSREEPARGLPVRFSIRSGSHPGD